MRISKKLKYESKPEKLMKLKMGVRCVNNNFQWGVNNVYNWRCGRRLILLHRFVICFI